MGVLQEFERRLEGAVEGFFARAFRSGLQPIDLAKALQRYAEDNQHVTDDGVVVPNSYRLNLSTRDVERLSSYGQELPHELAGVVERTAAEKRWHLRGPGKVRITTSEEVRVGRYQLTGRVEAGPRPAPQPQQEPAPQHAPATPSPDPQPTPAPNPTPQPATQTRAIPAAAIPMLVTPDGNGMTLAAARSTVGRLPECDLYLQDTTVSREHAALVRRGDQWWVLDLGSTNGTRVNGIAAAEQPLRDGDVVEFGDVSVQFRLTSRT